MELTPHVMTTRRARSRDFVELTKPGLTAMVLLTTLVGFYMASGDGLRPILLLHTIIGTALAAAGAAALNQYLERDRDARMVRTQSRPLPSGRLEPAEALLFSAMVTAAGLAYLLLFVNGLTAALGLLVVGTYVFVYTPLKTRTSLCTLVGAFPGAAPLVLGWTAAGREIDAVAVSLFAIPLLWQMPHFLAVALMYADDYTQGGFSVRPAEVNTGRQIVFFCCALVPVSLVPGMLGVAGTLYLLGAALLGLSYLGCGVALALIRSVTRARRLFVASVFYLPALLGLMMVDKV